MTNDTRAAKAAETIDRVMPELLRLVGACEGVAASDIRRALVTRAVPTPPSRHGVVGGGLVPAAALRSTIDSCSVKEAESARVARDYAAMADKLEDEGAIVGCLHTVAAACQAVAEEAEARKAECRARSDELEAELERRRARAELWQDMHDRADEDLTSVLLGISERLDALEGNG